MSIQFIIILGLLMIVSCYFIVKALIALLELLTKFSVLFIAILSGIVFLIIGKTYLNTEIDNHTGSFGFYQTNKSPKRDFLRTSFNGYEDTLEEHERAASINKVVVEHHVYFKNAPQTQTKAINIAPSLKVNNVNMEDVIQEVITAPFKTTYYCNQFELPTPRYILMESFFSEERNAQNRVAFLKAKGFKSVHYVWLPCFESDINKELFAVILGRTCRMEETIITKQKKYERIAKKLNVSLISNTYNYLESTNATTFH